MVVVLNVMHKLQMLGTLITLASKSYEHFWNLSLANSFIIIVSDIQTHKKIVIFVE